MKASKATPLILLLSLAVTPGMAQKLYKWVDKDGNVHYSDQVPPDEVDKAREELNEQGIVVESVARALTPEERAEQERLTRELEAERQRIEELQREDDKLLRMYASVEEIQHSQVQQVEAIDRSITAAQAYINGQSKNLASLLERAAQSESQGQKVSNSLTKMIKDVRSQIAEQEAFVASRENEKQQIIEEYKALIARFRVVKERNS